MSRWREASPSTGLAAQMNQPQMSGCLKASPPAHRKAWLWLPTVKSGDHRPPTLHGSYRSAWEASDLQELQRWRLDVSLLGIHLDCHGILFWRHKNVWILYMGCKKRVSDKGYWEAQHKLGQLGDCGVLDDALAANRSAESDHQRS